MSTVCKALRQGRVPVKRPLTNPKADSAASVTNTDQVSAAGTSRTARYGASGMNPPAT